MSKFKITEDAQEDLVGIRQYTLENWGSTQSQKYLEELKQKLLLIAENPLIGKTREDIGKKICSFSHGSHMLYYTLVRKQIVLFAVLHTSMIPENHLEQRPKE